MSISFEAHYGEALPSPIPLPQDTQAPLVDPYCSGEGIEEKLPLKELDFEQMAD